ncbi:hypothetical protein SMAC4_13212 [Sordaria macrospora]|uniref:uncharacterized protein n=1 Tax=Sordaria macrospora TaxID=5147 RepID=UPI002B2A95E1|nr:hypothetical protein SMAC4_13212 [Sordaria macrospora]
MSALSTVRTAFPATMITVPLFSDLKGASISAAWSLLSRFTHKSTRNTRQAKSDEFRNGFGHGAAVVHSIINACVPAWWVSMTVGQAVALWAGFQQQQA